MQNNDKKRFELKREDSKAISLVNLRLVAHAGAHSSCPGTFDEGRGHLCSVWRLAALRPWMTTAC